MPEAPLTKLGIVRCRDLVQLYYGGRMVADSKETSPALSTTDFLEIVAQDPRRVRYEINFANEDVAVQIVTMGSQNTNAAGTPQQFSIPAGQTLSIKRDFTTDLDLVTKSVWANASSENVICSIRETILTPLPVDESV